MSLDVITPDTGRGAWPGNGRGGTLSSTGHSRGGFYALSDGSLPLVGLAGARAARAGGQVGLDEYAVWRAVVALQSTLNGATKGVDLDVDGVLGQATAAALASWQKAHALTDDGVLGPKSARVLFTPAIVKASASTSWRDRAQVTRLVTGHVTIESGFDPGAVGVSTPEDVGLGQVNGPAHPGLSFDDRLDPQVALGYVADLVASNLAAFDGVEVDAVAAYMLGQAGCRTWIKAGRPAAWQRRVGGQPTTVYVRRYVDSVLSAATA